ncbi:MAG TPA: hypothetical protein VF666_12620 [Pyrinomonadaceae bacterium]
MSKEPPVREVVPFKPGKRQSTARRLNIDFAGGTALEEALAGQQKAETTNHHSPPLPTTPHHSSQTPQSSLNQSADEKPTAPMRDFNKRANSLERDAMPAGLFPGSTFKVYNALYLRSRGAVVPTRFARASRRDLLDWTGIKNIKTIDNHLRYLMAKGLVIRHWELGSNEGSEYELFLPEEVPQPVSTTPHHSPPLSTTQKTSSGYTQFLGSGGEGQTIENKDTSGSPKTYIRLTENFDDEAFAGLVEELTKITVEITGKSPAKADDARWRELAEVLITELKIAAARTNVSSVPAFLTEHLRRRLWKIDKKQIEEQSGEKKSTDTIDASKCPDCGATGWWYPNGPDKGVARCTHRKLRTQDDASA